MSSPVRQVDSLCPVPFVPFDSVLSAVRPVGLVKNSMSKDVSVSRWSPAVQSDRLDLIDHTLTLGDDFKLGILCAPVRLV